MITTKLSSKKKMRNTLFICFLIMLCLIGRLGFIQFVRGSELTSMAYQQQTLDRKINPKRGTIYDATGEKMLAVSSTVETVSVNPGNISKENKEKVAKKLSELFELDYEKTLKKVTKRSSIETIIRKQEKKNKKLTRFFDVVYIDIQNPSRNFLVKNAYITPQGTSSMKYPKKNCTISIIKR